jgi:hypothetical protein
MPLYGKPIGLKMEPVVTEKPIPLNGEKVVSRLSSAETKPMFLAAYSLPGESRSLRLKAKGYHRHRATSFYRTPHLPIRRAVRVTLLPPASNRYR